MSATASCRACLIVVLFMGCALPCSAHAEVSGEDVRYDFLKLEDGRYRFDRVTGEMEKLERDAGGFVWIKVPIRQSNKSPVPDAPVLAGNNTKNTAAVSLPTPHQTEMANLAEPKQKSTIKLFDDQGNDVTDAITDFDRKRCEAKIASYESKISIPHTIQMGDRVTGTILLRNNGDRKLKQLELSLFIPVIGKDKPDVTHYMFSTLNGSVPPPQPNSDPLVQKVDLQSPAGSGKGIPEVKITYISFDE